MAPGRPVGASATPTSRARWVLATPYLLTWDPDEPLQQLVGWIGPSRSTIASWIADGSVRGPLSVVGYQGDRGPSIYLDASVVREIVELGVDLSVDFHVVGRPSDGDEG
jgi:hypothetical protein